MKTESLVKKLGTLCQKLEKISLYTCKLWSDIQCVRLTSVKSKRKEEKFAGIKNEDNRCLSWKVGPLKVLSLMYKKWELDNYEGFVYEIKNDLGYEKASTLIDVIGFLKKENLINVDVMERRNVAERHLAPWYVRLNITNKGAALLKKHNQIDAV